jgi:hypothetical protein
MWHHVIVEGADVVEQRIASVIRVKSYARFEVFTAATEEWRLLGCYAVWLL